MSHEDNYEEIKAKNFKFGAVGDFLVGTLVDVSKTTSPDKYNKLSHIYKVKTKEGSFYDSTKNEKTGKFKIDEQPTIVEAGEDYVFFVSNDKGTVISKMKDVIIGQKFKIQFTETKPTTKGNDAKIIKIFAGKNPDGSPLMDQEYLDSQKSGLDEFDGKKDEEK